MKTLSEIISWLKTPDHIRIILVEVNGVLIEGTSSTLYLSNKPFTTTTTDTPASTSYTNCIAGGINFNESLSLEGSASIGYGDLELDNTKGIRDSWLNYVWTNRQIKIFIGDPRWNKSDYYMIFDGIVSDIASRSNNTINIVLLDKLQRLNNPITETVLGGTGSNKDRVLPLLFGECFNVEPLNTDSIPNILEYMVHSGPIEDIIEVRDKGVPVPITKNLAQGKFTLQRSPAGQITASVQGSKPSTYTANIAEIIKYIVTNYGLASTKLSLDDIDIANFNSFASTHTNPVGYYCKDRTNIIDICQKLAQSAGASLTCTSRGLLRLVRLSIPGNSTSYSISPDDIEYNSFSISDKVTVKGSVKLTYSKNWTVQQAGSLAGSVNNANISIFDREWMTTTSTNSTVITDYKLSSEPIQEETYLLTESPATTEATRRLNLWSTPRFIFSMVGYAHLLPIELGDTIYLTHPRFGLSNTVGTVINIDRNWIAGKVTLGVLV